MGPGFAGRRASGRGPSAARQRRPKRASNQYLTGQSNKEVDDGIWIVSFMHYDLGFIDLEQKTLQPLDNPFGTGLSPMS
jgi:hypothetical protein